MIPATTLGIIAGGGPFPARVAAAAVAAGRRVFVVGLQGFAEMKALRPYPHIEVRLGAAGSMLGALRDAGCVDLVLIGPVRRPSLASLRPRWRGSPHSRPHRARGVHRR